MCEKISQKNAVYVIDEIDSIENSEDKKKIAELIKQLSDSGAQLKILLVGIAETPSELTAGHPSVSRCLREVKLNNMRNSELKEIIISGANKLGLTFETRAINKIIHLSSGYPHFTHLLALKAGEEAIVEERKNVTYADLIKGLDNAIDDAEGSLRTSYDNAVRSTNGKLKNLLLAIALCPDYEITTKEIRNQYNLHFEEDILQGTLNNYFKRLVADDNSKILKRLVKGVYKFNDPRMPSFIRIAQNYLKIRGNNINS